MLQINVQGWLKTGLVCLKETPSDADGLLIRAEEEMQRTDKGGPSLWYLLAPFRNVALTPAFVGMLSHSVRYHVQIGFSGVLLYASPFLIREIMKSDVAREQIQEGKLVLIKWESFNAYSAEVSEVVVFCLPLLPTDPPPPCLSQANHYTETLDLRCVYNHAMNVMRPFKHTGLMIADADEFLVLKSPLKTVQQLVHKRSCMESREKLGFRPWATLTIKRFNYRSALSSEAERSQPDGISAGGAVDAAALSTMPEVYLWRVRHGSSLLFSQTFMEANTFSI